MAGNQGTMPLRSTFMKPACRSWNQRPGLGNWEMRVRIPSGAPSSHLDITHPNRKEFVQMPQADETKSGLASSNALSALGPDAVRAISDAIPDAVSQAV